VSVVVQRDDECEIFVKRNGGCGALMTLIREEGK
jgi:hypothetical protein